jgi:hypothetical protein
MKKRVWIIGLMVLTIFLVQNISAKITTNIDVHPSFKEGQQMQFTYTIISDQNEEITYIPIIECENAPLALLIKQKVTLTANKPFASTYMDKNITEDYEPQKCTASVNVISPIKQEFKKNFTLATQPSFNLNVQLCKDPQCQQLGKIFTVDESIYIKISPSDKKTGETLNPSFQVIHKTPTQTIPIITKNFAFSRIQTPEIGVHTIKIQATHSKYKTMKQTIYFGVLQKHAKIEYSPIDKILSNKNIETEIPDESATTLSNFPITEENEPATSTNTICEQQGGLCAETCPPGYAQSDLSCEINSNPNSDTNIISVTASAIFGIFDSIFSSSTETQTPTNIEIQPESSNSKICCMLMQAPIEPVSTNNSNSTNSSIATTTISPISFTASVIKEFPEKILNPILEFIKTLF